MQLDSKQFAQIVAAAGSDKAAVSAADALAIIRIARLVAAADQANDEEERSMCETVVTHVAALAKIAVPPMTNDLVDAADPDDPGAQLIGVGAQLRGKPVADLAFALAYLVSISDLDLAPEEEELGEELRDALDITEDRADELAMLASEIVTPEE